VVPPEGITVVNYLQKGGVPANPRNLRDRQYPPYQLVIHRGGQVKSKREDNYAQSTERFLDANGCSSTWTLNPDGVFYQHFDPANLRGIHCASHNRQSDSIDVAGPILIKKGLEGQERKTIQVAPGKKNDHLPPLKRKMVDLECWSLTPAQRESLKIFVPWYCGLIGVPAVACDEWRTFRLSGYLKEKDPVTDGVKGIIAHAHVANPGSRLDGWLPLQHLKEDGAEIEWRGAEDFFNRD
jgi:hypothetical protein